MYVKYERKKMVQLIQGFINSLTFSSVTNGSGLDTVDPNFCISLLYFEYSAPDLSSLCLVNPSIDPTNVK